MQLGSQRGLHAIVLTVVAAVAASGGEPAVPAAWKTPAEASGYAATPSLEQTMTFLARLAARLPAMTVASFGTSAQGRPLPLVIVSRDRAFTPESAARVGKPVVLIQAGIHAGEIDGNDACLALLRDWALGRRTELLDAATLLIVPIYNVDGHERVSPFNRANQLGPEQGLGFRTTTTGLDLNRDFLKAQAPETRAMLALVNTWRPDLHVDIHVTDGSDFAWVLTATWAEAPQVAPSVDGWLAAHMPPVMDATRAAGYPAGPYVELVDRSDPRRGISSWVGGGRYATGYFPLRNRPSVLIEMHAYKPYAERVPAVEAFLVALLEELRHDSGSLSAAVRAADAREVALGAPEAPPTRATVSFKETSATDTVSFPIYAWTSAPSLVTGKPMLRYRRGAIDEITVPWFHRVEAETTVPRPRGYLIEAGWPQIEAALAAHGLRVERLSTPVRLETEALTATAPRFASDTYQGLTPLEATITAETGERSYPAGTLWVGADQPDFEVAVQLLEPEGPDSLFRWGLLSTVLERKEYIDGRRLDELATAMLSDPATAAAWAQALRDPSFASDSRRRTSWWYERTPYYAAQRVGLLPVARLLAGHPPGLEPWSRR